MSRVVSTSHLLVLVQSLLSQFKGLPIDDSRHWNGNPFLDRCRFRAVTRPYWFQSRFAPSSCHWTGPATAGVSGIGWISQDASYGGYVPPPLASRRQYLLLAELFGDPVQRTLLAYFWWLRWFSVPAEDLFHNFGLAWIHPHPARITRPFRIQDVAIGSHCPWQQGTITILGSATPSHPIGDQIAFVLGHCTANLQQQLVMRIVTHRTFQELDLAP